jgi:hypothetical protein
MNNTQQELASVGSNSTIEQERADMLRRDNEYARMQCLAYATELHKGAYDHTVVLKAARAYYDFIKNTNQQ